MGFFPFIPFLLQFLNLFEPLFGSIFFCFPGKDSSLVLGFDLTEHFVSGFGIDIHQNKSIPNEVVFDQLIQRSISRKTGCVVNFKEITFVVCIYHEVKSQHLKTHIVFQIVGLTDAVLMLQMGLS